MTDGSYDEPDDDQGQVLKTDVLGRVHTPASQREAILDAFEQSGLSGTKFAKQHGINYQTFASWRQKRKRARGEYPDTDQAGNAADDFTFLEIIPDTDKEGSLQAMATQPEPAGAIVVEVGREVKLRVECEAQIALAAKLIRSITPHH